MYVMFQGQSAGDGEDNPVLWHTPTRHHRQNQLIHSVQHSKKSIILDLVIKKAISQQKQFFNFESKKV